MTLLFETLQKEAEALRFPVSGGVDLEPAIKHPYFIKSLTRYEAWLAQGSHGEMAYMERGLERKKDPTLLLRNAKSAFVVLSPYRRTALGELDPSKGVRYARYLAGPDYHDEIKLRLTQVLERCCNSLGLKFDFKVCVDTSAVLERTWAALAGLGWIGKNTLLIHPKLGSYHFIAVAFLSEPLGRAPNLLPNFCGHCTLCLRTCPTQAITVSEGVESRRCISYLTLEDRKTLTLPPELTQRLGNWVAGCDLCQEACPYNRKPSQLEHAMTGGVGLVPDEGIGALSLNSYEDLLCESELEYQTRVKTSALNRIKPSQFKRNLGWVLQGQSRRTQD